MKVITLTAVPTNNLSPEWKLDYDGKEESFGNQIKEAIRRIDYIWKKTKGNVDSIHLIVNENRLYPKELIKRQFFKGKPYLNNVKVTFIKKKR